MWQRLAEHLRNHGTKYLGGVQTTVGAIAANAGDFFSRRELQVMLMVSGVLTAWRGIVNTKNSQV